MLAQRRKLLQTLPRPHIPHARRTVRRGRDQAAVVSREAQAGDGLGVSLQNTGASGKPFSTGGGAVGCVVRHVGVCGGYSDGGGGEVDDVHAAVGAAGADEVLVGVASQRLQRMREGHAQTQLGLQDVVQHHGAVQRAGQYSQSGERVHHETVFDWQCVCTPGPVVYKRKKYKTTTTRLGSMRMLLT